MQNLCEFCNTPGSVILKRKDRRMEKQNEVILEMRNIVKSFPGVKALDHAGLRLKKGEVHALIGENGAGKSTLMKILLGIYHQDEGDVIYKGEKVYFKVPHDALTAGISMIHQEISLIPTVSVAENIWIGRENNFTKLGIIDTKKEIRKLKNFWIDLESK